MSTSPAPEDRTVASHWHTITRPVAFVGFWSAVAIPLVLVAMLATGAANNQITTFLGLLALNGAALVAGRDYKRA
ncbi:MAG: hypothetical protein ABEJ31_04615 [Haloarculaceae archaeon]